MLPTWSANICLIKIGELSNQTQCLAMASFKQHTQYITSQIRQAVLLRTRSPRNSHNMTPGHAPPVAVCTGTATSRSDCHALKAQPQPRVSPPTAVQTLWQTTRCQWPVAYLQSQSAGRRTNDRQSPNQLLGAPGNPRPASADNSCLAWCLSQ